jgi:hypothetical protein
MQPQSGLNNQFSHQTGYSYYFKRQCSLQSSSFAKNEPDDYK